MAISPPPEEEAPEILSIGMIQGASRGGLRFVSEDLGEFMRLVAQEAASWPNDGLRLNLIFFVPGDTLSADHEGVKPGRFFAKRDLLVVGAAVPPSLVETETTSYIRLTVADAIDAADARMKRKRLQLDSANLRGFAAHVGGLLPDHPLDGASRYREEVFTSNAEGLIKAYSELDAGGRDLRRIEVYADGGIDYAVRTIETGGTKLRRERVPPRGAPIPETRFEQLWQLAIRQPAPRGPIRVVPYPAA